MIRFAFFLSLLFPIAAFAWNTQVFETHLGKVNYVVISDNERVAIRPVSVHRYPAAMFVSGREDSGSTVIKVDSSYAFELGVLIMKPDLRAMLEGEEITISHETGDPATSFTHKESLKGLREAWLKIPAALIEGTH